MSTSARNRVVALVDNPLSNNDGGNLKLFHVLSIVVRSVCYGAFENLEENLRALRRHEPERVECLLSRHASDDGSFHLDFLRRYSDIASNGFHDREERVTVCSQTGDRLLISGVSYELAGEREFSELVSDHIFCNEYRKMCFSIVYTEGVSNEIRDDGAIACPCLDDGLLSRFI